MSTTDPALIPEPPSPSPVRACAPDPFSPAITRAEIASLLALGERESMELCFGAQSISDAMATHERGAK